MASQTMERRHADRYRFTHRLCAALWVASALALSQAGWAQTAQGSQAVSQRLTVVADSVARQTGFSGTVLVARGEQVLLSKGYGLASHEWGIANTPEVKFLLASVSKQFTAAAVLRLVDQGRLKLDDPVHQHLPGTPANWRNVTVRQLLAHTAGIPNHTEGPEFEQMKQRPHSPRQLLASFSTKPLDFEPGSRMRYSNSGYVLAGLLVETLSGKSWGEFVNAELLAPLGMGDSGIASNAAITPRLATGYVRQGPATQAKLLPAGFLHLSVPYAAGAMFGNTGDLLKWQRGLYNGTVLSPASLKQMTTPLLAGYALGLNVNTQGPQTVYGHSGGITGFSSYLQYEPQAQLSIAVLSNVEGIDLQPFVRKLSAVANGKIVRLPEERPTFALSAEAMSALQGSYRLNKDQTFWVVRHADALWARMNNEAWTRLWPESELSFFAPDVDGEVRFARGPDGRIQSLTLPGMADDRAWPRVELALPSLSAQPIYLRGSMNNWSTRHRLVAGNDGIHRIRLDLEAGDHELKVASEDWQQVDLGQRGQSAPLPGSQALPLSTAGGNIGLSLPAARRCHFEVDGRQIVEPSLRVSCQAR